METFRSALNIATQELGMRMCQNCLKKGYSAITVSADLKLQLQQLAEAKGVTVPKLIQQLHQSHKQTSDKPAYNLATKNKLHSQKAKIVWRAGWDLNY